MNSLELLDAATALRHRYPWLDQLFTNLIGPPLPQASPHAWLDQLTAEFHRMRVYQAACREYEVHHPEPHDEAEEVWAAWRNGLPEQPRFVKELSALSLQDRMAVLLTTSLGTDLSPPGWRVLDLGRFTERELPFFWDWVDIVSSQGRDGLGS